MISRKKKIFILAGMIALLVATGVLNIYLNRTDNGTVPGGGGGVTYGSIFDTYRADKKATREETLLVLDNIISTGSVDAKAQAEAQALTITQEMVMETKLEGMIRALGFSEVVVTTSTSKINVILKADDLDEVQVAQIAHIIISETGKNATDIRIIPVS